MKVWVTFLVCRSLCCWEWNLPPFVVNHIAFLGWEVHNSQAMLNPLLPPCKWGWLNLGHQAWQPLPLPMGSSCSLWGRGYMKEGGKWVGAVVVSTVPDHSSFRCAVQGFFNTHEFSWPLANCLWYFVKLDRSGPTDGTQLIECLPSTKQSLTVWSSAPNKWSDVLHAFDPSTPPLR